MELAIWITFAGTAIGVLIYFADVQRKKMAEQAATAIRDRQRAGDEVARRSAERTARIDRVVDSYRAMAMASKDSGMSAALTAGISDLHDAGEVQSAIAGIARRCPRDPVIPSSLAAKIPENQLLEFFRRLPEVDNWKRHGHLVDGMISDLRRELGQD